MKIKKSGIWWKDGNENRWDARILTRQEAEYLSKTMENCTNCTDCARCIDCTNCRNCDDCQKCINCTSCESCIHCENCINCLACTCCDSDTDLYDTNYYRDSF